MQKFRQFAAFGGVVLLFSVVQCQLLNGILPTTTTTAAPPYQGQPYCTAAQAPATSLPTCADASLQDLKNAREIPGNDDRSSGLLPSWINIPLARQGQAFASKNLLGIIYGFLLGLSATGYRDGSTLLTFARDGFNSTQNQVAGTVTVVQILVWFQDFLKDTPNATTDDILISIQRVRNIHIATANAANQQIANTGYIIPEDYYTSRNTTLVTAWNGTFQSDLIASTIPQSQRVLPPSSWTNITTIVPMNQQIQALTQNFFFAYAVLFPTSLGIAASDSDLWAYNHFWAVMGFAMGVDDKYNVALMPDLPTQKQYLQNILTNFTIPNLFNMDFNQLCLGETFLLSMGPETAGLFTGNLILYRLAKDILKIDAPNTYNILTVQEKATSLLLDQMQSPLYQNSLAGSTASAAFFAGFYADGLNIFGSEFVTQDSRARNVFFAKFMDNYTSPSPIIPGPNLPIGSL